MKISDPLEFCETCFHRSKPVLCETIKSTFTKISSIHFSQQAKLDRLLTRLQVTPRMSERRWTCTLPSDLRKEFLDSLWGIGITVHTLDDHLRTLVSLYKPEVRPLGNTSAIKLPTPGLWEEFDPKGRNWKNMKVEIRDGEHFSEASLGNIVRCSGTEGTDYYRLNKTEGPAVLVPLEKRAAYNLMCTLAEPSVVQWKPDKADQQGVVDLDDLAEIPDEILSFLHRLGKKDKKLPSSLVFESDDMELVSKSLKTIKITLEKSGVAADLSSSDGEGAKVPLDMIGKERLQTVLDVIKEMGGTCEKHEDRLLITGKRGTATLTFMDGDKSSQDGNEISVSVSALDSPQRFSEVVSMIKKRAGLLDASLESLLAYHWPIVNDSDMQFVLQSAISWYSSNPVVAAKIISKDTKLPVIKEWHKKIREGKIRSNLDTVSLGKIIKRLESA